MKEYKVKITHQAQDQLWEIYTYIRDTLQAPLAANHVLAILEEAADSLAYMPSRIKLTNETKWADQDVHRLHAHHFFLYFWIDEGKRIVQIFAVIYSQRDQEKILNTIYRETI